MKGQSYIPNSRYRMISSVSKARHVGARADLHGSLEANYAGEAWLRVGRRWPEGIG